MKFTVVSGKNSSKKYREVESLATVDFKDLPEELQEKIEYTVLNVSRKPAPWSIYSFSVNQIYADSREEGLKILNNSVIEISRIISHYYGEPYEGKLLLVIRSRPYGYKLGEIEGVLDKEFERKLLKFLQFQLLI